MGEEVRMTDYEFAAAAAAGDEEEARVVEWEDGLPGVDDLTPLSQSLVPPELASAFSISPEPSRSVLDVNRASQDTLSGLRSQSFAFSSNNFKSFNDDRIRDSQVVEGDEDTREGWAAAAIAAAASDSRKLRRLDCAEEADSALRQESSCADDPAAAAGRGGMKRPRLVWTPQLHKRFVDVVGHLGIQNAVPKTIMQLMNVDGLTRENVASHLQKYRLYLKRMQGLPSNEGNSISDVFASTPVQHNSQESGGHANGHMPPVPYPMPYGTPVMQMPFYGHMGMPPGGAVGYHGFESYPYTMQQRDWSGNKFGTVVPYHHATTQNDK